MGLAPMHNNIESKKKKKKSPRPSKYYGSVFELYENTLRPRVRKRTYVVSSNKFRSYLPIGISELGGGRIEVAGCCRRQLADNQACHHAAKLLYIRTLQDLDNTI